MGMNNSKVPSLGMLALNSLFKGDGHHDGMTLREIKNELCSNFDRKQIIQILPPLVGEYFNWFLGDYTWCYIQGNYLLAINKSTTCFFCMNTQTGIKYGAMSGYYPVISNDGKMATHTINRETERDDTGRLKVCLFRGCVTVFDNEAEQLDHINVGGDCITTRHTFIEQGELRWTDMGEEHIPKTLTFVNENMLFGALFCDRIGNPQKWKVWTYDLKTKTKQTLLIEDNKNFSWHPLTPHSMIGIPESFCERYAYALMNISSDGIELNPVVRNENLLLVGQTFPLLSFYHDLKKRIEFRKIDSAGIPGAVKYSIPCKYTPHAVSLCNNLPVVIYGDGIQNLIHIPGIRIQPFKADNCCSYMSGILMIHQGELEDEHQVTFEDTDPRTLGAWLWCAKQKYINEDSKLLPMIGRWRE